LVVPRNGRASAVDGRDDSKATATADALTIHFAFQDIRNLPVTTVIRATMVVKVLNGVFLAQAYNAAVNEFVQLHQYAIGIAE
jgi:hypothetical protein